MMSSPQPLRGKMPPLHSTTTACPPPGKSQQNVKGCGSVRLDTYDDTSDIKAALRDLEAAFAVEHHDSPELWQKHTARKASPYAAERGASEPQMKRMEELRHQRERDKSPAEPTVVVVQTKRAERFPLKERGPPPLLKLSPQLLIYCFSFCDLCTLGALCSISVRLNVIVARQGSSLWLAAAQRRRIPIAVEACAREELRHVLEHRARERHAEEAYYEAEIERMEKRLGAWTHDTYAQNVDVQKTLQSSGACALVDAANTTPGPFWLRQQRLAAGQDGTSGEYRCGEASSSPDGNAPMTTMLCAKLRTEIAALEEMKRLCDCRLKLQEEQLQQQEQHLQTWRSLLLPVPAPNSAAPEPSDVTAAGASPLISASELRSFEHRIARLVLHSTSANYSPTPSGAAEDKLDLSIVLRRGVDNFAALEIVLHALHANVAKTSSESPNNTEAASTSSTTAAATNAEGAIREAAKRWCAFQKFCPINEEYENARILAITREQSPAAVVVGRLNVSKTTPSGGEVTPLPKPRKPSQRQVSALLRLSGFVRRVEAMSDAQVLQAWM